MARTSSLLAPGRRRSSAQRPRGPRSRPPTWAAGDLGAGLVGGLHRGQRDRPDALAAAEVRGLLGLAAEPHVQRRAHRRQHRGGGAGVAGHRRVEAVRAEHLLRRGRELRPEDVAERDRAAARLDDRDRLRGGELPARAPGDPAQRLGHRLDGAEVRAGADDDLGAAARRSRRTAWSRCRTAVGGLTRWVTSLAPIITTATSNVEPATRSICAGEVAAARADRGHAGELHRPVGALREAGGQHRAGRLVRVVDAEPAGARVAEHQQLQRLAGVVRAVDAVGRRRLPGRLADRPAGQRRLGADQPERARRQDAQPAAAVRRRHRDPPRHPRLGHPAS